MAVNRRDEPRGLFDDPTSPRPTSVYDTNLSTSRLAELWSGGRATAGVAIGVAAVGFLLIRGIAHIPIFGSTRAFFLFASCYLVGAALLALIATTVMRLLLLRTPRPRVFFGWIAAVVVAIACLLPLVPDYPFEEQVGIAFINLITTAAIATLEAVSADAISDDSTRPKHIDPPGSY